MFNVATSRAMNNTIIVLPTTIYKELIPEEVKNYLIKAKQGCETSVSSQQKVISSGNVQVKVMIYKTQKVDSSTQGASYRVEQGYTLAANQNWTRYTIELDPTVTYYGYAILITSDWKNEGLINFDAAYFTKGYDDCTCNFFAKSGLALSGNITAGPATMTFGDNGAVTLNNTNLGGDLVGKYWMEMQSPDQVFIIETSKGSITGKYTVSNTGVVTFTVTYVEGDLAAGVNVGAVLTNAH